MAARSITVPKEIRVLLSRDVFDWSVADVGLWIDYIGLPHCKQLFIENVISGMSLLELDSDDLRYLGLTRVGDRKIFLRALRQISGDVAGSSSSGSSQGGDSASEEDSWEVASCDSGSSRGSRSQRSRSSKFTQHQIKAYYRDRAKTFTCAKDSSLGDIKAQVRKLFHHHMHIYYRDSEGDKISLKKDKDWSTCKKACGERIRLFCKSAHVRHSSRKSQMVALESLADPVVVTDTQGYITLFNAAAESFFGFKAKSVIGSKVNILMPDDIASKHDSYIQHYLDTGIKVVIGTGRKVVAQKRNGELSPVFLTLSETSGKTDKRFIATLQPITESVSEDAIIREDQTIQFGILQNLIDAAIVINQTGIIRFFNAAAEELFGYKASFITGKNVSLLMQGKDKREHDNYIRNYLVTGRSTVIGKGRDVVAAMADGSLKSVHLSVSEQKFPNASLFTGIIRSTEPEPVTASLSGDPNATSILSQTREVLDNLLIAAIIADDHGQILGYNEAASQLLGYQPAEVIGRNVHCLCPPEHEAYHDMYLQKWRETGEEHVFGVGRDVTAKTKAGEIIPVRLSVSKRLDESKRYLVTATLQRR